MTQRHISHPDPLAACGITVVYTVISIVRGYLVRRFFNRMEVRRG